MAKFIALGVAILALVSMTVANEEPAGFEARLEVVEDIADFKATHPEMDVIPLEVTQNTRVKLVYTLGNRVSGDRLVAKGGDGVSWDTLKNVSLSMAYPPSGTGAVVSYVEVVVEQSSTEGRAYVVSGGVGQRFVNLVVEAYRTSYFKYSGQVYGY